MSDKPVMSDPPLSEAALDSEQFGAAMVVTPGMSMPTKAESLADRAGLPARAVLALIRTMAPSDFEVQSWRLKQMTPSGLTLMAARQDCYRKGLAMMRDGAKMLYAEHLDLPVIDAAHVAKELVSEDREEADRYIAMAMELADMRVKSGPRSTRASTSAGLRDLIKTVCLFWHEQKGRWPTRGFMEADSKPTAMSPGAIFVCDALRASGWDVTDAEVMRQFQEALKQAQVSYRGTPGQE